MSDKPTVTPEAVRNIVTRIVPALPESDDAELLFSGVIDSLTLMEIAEMLEEDLQISLTPADMKADNFASIRAMARMLDEKEVRRA